MKLTTNRVRVVRTPGKYRDDDSRGLFLHVVSPAKRYWMFRFTLQGRTRTMALGNADIILLSEARRRCLEARAQLARGIDPLEARRRPEKPVQRPDFAAVVDAYVEAHRASWKGYRAAEQWQRSLTIHAVPRLGRIPVDAIAVGDVLAVLAPIWVEMPVTAVRVRSRIELVLAYAKARGWRDGPNAAAWKDNLQPLLPSHARVHRVTHRAALPWREAPGLLQALHAQDGVPAACLAMLLLTATRSAEARGMRWDEIDREQKLWVIPGTRTKSGREHRIPLSPPALAILDQLGAVRATDLVFPGHQRGRELANTTLRDLLTRLGFTGVPHGLRSTFRDWVSDSGGSDAAGEAALGHAVPGRTVAAYRRTDLLEPRRILMNDWAAYLTRPAADVVALPFTKKPAA